MKKMKYRIENRDDQGRKLLCPGCGEELAPLDVESFHRCPYCDAPLEDTPELEDFILDGVARHWENRVRHGAGS